MERQGRFVPLPAFRNRSQGVVMEVLTTQPGVQFYSGNFLDGSNKGKGGKPYNRRYGFCRNSAFSRLSEPSELPEYYA